MEMLYWIQDSKLYKYCTVFTFFFGLVLGEKHPVYFFLFGIFEILAPNQHF